MARTYWEKAFLFVKNGTTDPKNPPWFELNMGDAAVDAWADYFRRHLRWQPGGWRLFEQRKCRTFLVPCERPEWFDVNYTPPRYLPKWPAPDPEITPESRRRVAEIARLVRGGVSSMQDVASEERRQQRARQERERHARRIEGDLQASGIVTPEGQLPVSAALRQRIAEQNAAQATRTAERAQEAAE